ncbi:unnamed protein product [Effrenium voratum]|uniref:Uncharacterized protein n=1 Tax=Effrenium voratum TaxID=2562239 RepID=A0AA36J6M9_9DINO|nr:unnamed protein product [Effrenium voratum]
MAMPWVLRAAVLLLAEGQDCEDAPISLLQRRGQRVEDNLSSDSIARLLWLTDLHGDPFYLTSVRQCQKRTVEELQGFSFGFMGCDPPFGLMGSAAAAARSFTEADAEFVLYTGDFSRHRMLMMEDPYTNVSNIIGSVAGIIKGHFKNLPNLFGALGNDDNPANYFQNITTDQATNPWFRSVSASMQRANCMSNETRQQYDYGSFFEAQYGNLTILSIATVIYSVQHQPSSPSGLPTDPFRQLAWLRRKLGEAFEEDRRVWIVGHIPPGMETFGYTQLWHPQYLEAYLEIVQDPELGSVIAAQLFGHVHKEEIRLLPDPPPNAGPILLSASLSPVYYNQPAFRSVSYDRNTGDVLDFDTFYANVSSKSNLDWAQGYSFTDLFQTSLTMTGLKQLAGLLLKGGEMWEKYTKWYTTTYPNDLMGVGSPRGPLPADQESYRLLRRHQYVCALTIRTASSYQDCVTAAVRATWTPKTRDESLGAAGGFSPDIGRLVASIPLDFEEGHVLALGKLLRWAELSPREEARQIVRLARHGEWHELLHTFGPAVDKAWEMGIPLDEALER